LQESYESIKAVREWDSIGYPETSVTTNNRFVTFQESEDLTPRRSKKSRNKLSRFRKFSEVIFLVKSSVLYRS